METVGGSRRSDVTRSVAGLLLFYGLPAVAITVTSGTGRSVVWPLAFTAMGLRCAVNAVRCGRVHCHFTGPWFFLAALASVVQGLGLADLGWQRIGWGALGGVALLWIVSEGLWGRYFEPPDGGRGSD